jgi:hypothetical protein
MASKEMKMRVQIDQALQMASTHDLPLILDAREILMRGLACSLLLAMVAI